MYVRESVEEVGCFDALRDCNFVITVNIETSLAAIVVLAAFVEEFSGVAAAV